MSGLRNRANKSGGGGGGGGGVDATITTDLHERLLGAEEGGSNSNTHSSNHHACGSPEDDETQPFVAAPHGHHPPAATAATPPPGACPCASGGGIATRASQFFADLLFALSSVLPFWDGELVREEHLRLLEPFRAAVATPFDADAPAHRTLLLSLWDACNGFVPDPEPLDDGGDAHDESGGTVSKKWGSAGFQGTNPATDFRGGGLLSLKNLLFLAEAEPELFGRLFRLCRAANRPEGGGAEPPSGRFALPLAIAGINLTLLLLHILQLTATRTCFSAQPKSGVTRFARRTLTGILVDAAAGAAAAAAADDEEAAAAASVGAMEAAFGRVYCEAFKVLDRLWAESDGNIMKFNSVLHEVWGGGGRGGGVGVFFFFASLCTTLSLTSCLNTRLHAHRPVTSLRTS